MVGVRPWGPPCRNTLCAGPRECGARATFNCTPGAGLPPTVPIRPIPASTLGPAATIPSPERKEPPSREGLGGSGGQATSTTSARVNAPLRTCRRSLRDSPPQIPCSSFSIPQVRHQSYMGHDQHASRTVCDADGLSNCSRLVPRQLICCLLKSSGYGTYSAASNCAMSRSINGFSLSRHLLHLPLGCRVRQSKQFAHATKSPACRVNGWSVARYALPA